MRPSQFSGSRWRFVKKRGRHHASLLLEESMQRTSLCVPTAQKHSHALFKSQNKETQTFQDHSSGRVSDNCAESCGPPLGVVLLTRGGGDSRARVIEPSALPDSRWLRTRRWNAVYPSERSTGDERAAEGTAPPWCPRGTVSQFQLGCSSQSQALRPSC